eukprot:6473123-Ditylum_brightwellii.AAC.1
MIGFDTNNVTSAGSTKHWAFRQIFQMLLTNNQFCIKGKKVALLAKAIIEDGAHLSDVNALGTNLDLALFRELQQQYQVPVLSWT